MHGQVSTPEQVGDELLVPVELSEDALALQFTRRHRDQFIYCAEWGSWLRWDGRRWARERTLAALDLARDVCREATTGEEKRLRSRVRSAQTVAAVTKLASADRSHAVTSDQFDRDLWSINTPGGTVDLRTGELRPHRPADYFTKVTAVTPGGKCPNWLRCLDEWTDGDADMIAFLQRFIGYSLCGSTREEVFAFFYGEGRNGKGSFLNTLVSVLGDYSAVAPIDAFTVSKHERHPTDLASLRGARLVVAQETTEGRLWDETRLKTLTGSDPVTARFMRGDFFTYVPQFTLVVSGNHKPGLRNVDTAMRERLALVPFTRSFVGENRDPLLKEKLIAEGPGILRWAIEGCLRWQREGLNPPAAVQDATDSYFASQDVVRRWLDERCDIGSSASATKAALYADFKEWAEASGEYVLSQRKLFEQVAARGVRLDETRVGRNRDRTVIGLGLVGGGR